MSLTLRHSQRAARYHRFEQAVAQLFSAAELQAIATLDFPQVMPQLPQLTADLQADLLNTYALAISDLIGAIALREGSDIVLVVDRRYPRSTGTFTPLSTGWTWLALHEVATRITHRRQLEAMPRR